MSRSARALIGVVIVVIAAGGWWLRTRGAAPVPATAEGGHNAAPAASGREGRAQRGGEPGEVPRFVLEDDPKGELRLEGQVVDEDSHGVASATVVISSNPPRSILTEADGSFAFDGLVARPYTLVARATRGVAGPVTARLTAKSDPVVLRLHPAAMLTVNVVGTDGKPVSGATVELRGVDVQRAVTKAGAAVFAPVVPGGYQLAAWADGMAHAFERLQIGKGNTAARLVLSRGAPVAGRVVDDRGAGLPGARVRYSGASDWTQQASDRYDAVVTGSDGSFRFDALPSGSFRFLASHPERAPGSSAIVTLDGVTPRDGVVISLDEGAVVKGHVIDRDHHPVAAARVRIGPSGPGGRGRGGRGPGGPGGPGGGGFEAPRQAFSDAQGAFEIRGLPRKQLSAIALHETGASQAVDVDASRGDVPDIVLALDITGTISGVVVDPQGQPVEGAQVTALPSFGGPGGGPGGSGGFDPAQFQLRGRNEEVTDGAGKFTLTGLVTGEQYRLNAAPATRTGPRGRGGFRDGVLATTGDAQVKLVVQPDGAVTGRVAFSDGSVPGTFTVAIQQNQTSVLGGDGKFTLEGIAPGDYQIAVRGGSFQNTAAPITVTGGTTVDAGTITVVKGRSIAGIVMANGQPVPNATVYAGRTVIGNGSTNSVATGPIATQFADGTKTTTTDAGGQFSISGFGDGDLTVVAELESVGRSKAMRLPTVLPGQTELSLLLQAFGSLSGALTQNGLPVPGIAVTCQATATPGALYTVLAGPDGAYRFDRLAPDTYKVSATVGGRGGMRFYSQQIDVPIGQEVTANLTVDPGTVALSVTVTASGAMGSASGWLASGSITASTATELSLALAAAGQGTSARTASGNGGPLQFTQIAPGAYTVCITPLPSQVRGADARTYLGQHADTLPVFCQPVTVAASPDAQSAQVSVTVPAYIPGSTTGTTGTTGGTPAGGTPTHG